MTTILIALIVFGVMYVAIDEVLKERARYLSSRPPDPTTPSRTNGWVAALAAGAFLVAELSYALLHDNPAMGKQTPEWVRLLIAPGQLAGLIAGLLSVPVAVFGLVAGLTGQVRPDWLKNIVAAYAVLFPLASLDLAADEWFRAQDGLAGQIEDVVVLIVAEAFFLGLYAIARKTTKASPSDTAA